MITNNGQIQLGRKVNKTRSIIIALLVGVATHSLDAAQPPQGYALSFSDNEVLGNYRYTGMGVVRQRTVLQHWRDQANQGPEFTRNNQSEDGEIEGHRGRRVIYAEPIRSQNGVIPRDQRGNFADLYNFVADLQPAEQIKLKPMFYRPDGENSIFYTHATQQRWRRISDNTFLDFLVVSYSPAEKLRFIDDARNSGGQVLNGHLPPAGLYTLDHLINEPTTPAVWAQRVETWKKLEGDGVLPEPTIEIRGPSGVLSIPGVGLFACNQRVDNRNFQDPELARLIRKVNKMKRITDQYLQGPAAQNPGVVIMGPTKSGKTTLLNLLGNCQAEARRKAGSRRAEDLEIYVPNELPEFPIGYQPESKTRYPRPLPNLVNGVRLWDTPGIYDTEGGMQEGGAKNVANILGIRKLFALNAGIKIGVTIRDSELDAAGNQIFLDLLKKTLDIFPEDAQLHNIFHLIVTQAPQGTTLEDYLTSFDTDTRVTSNPRLQNLINLLKAEPERISYFYKPTVVGAYDAQPNLQEIMDRIARTGVYTANLTVTQSLKGNSDGLVEKYARQLNEDVANYLRTEGAQGIIDYCNKVGRTHQGTAEELRTKYSNLKTRLEGLSRLRNPDDFVNELHGTQVEGVPGGIQQIFDATELKQLVDDLKFLKELHNAGVAYRTDNWARGFTDGEPSLNTLGKVQHLATPPTILPNAQDPSILEVKGVFFGINDIAQDANVRAGTIKRVVALSTNKIFIDQSADFVQPGLTMINISPSFMRTEGVKTFDLRGNPGEALAKAQSGRHGATPSENGTDGTPGNPGKNGGHFYLKGWDFSGFEAVNGVAQLIAKTQGGKGGNGQEGGDGGNGAAGSDAPSSVSDRGKVSSFHHFGGDKTNHANPFINTWLSEIREGNNIAQHEVTVTADRHHHYAAGSPGGTGGTPGKGGARGQGGHGGESVIEGLPSWQVVPSQQGASGDADGTPGTVGTGGANGKHRQGYKLINAKASYGLWNDKDGLKKGDYNDPLPEKWESAPALDATSSGSAANGTAQTALNADFASTNKNPTNQVQLDKAALRAAYKVYRDAQAKDPLISPFVRVFPGIE